MGLSTDIVITGVGVISPLGIGQQALWEAARDGRSGVRALASLEGTPWPVRFGADVKEFEPKKYVKPRKILKVMCREIQFGFSSATLAMDDGGVDIDHVDPDRFGVVCGTEMFYGDPTDLIEAVKHSSVDGVFKEEMWGDKALPHLYPLWMLTYLPNMVACHLAIAQDARGPNNTIAVGDASSLLAMIEAAQVIERGHADIMIVGGAGSRLGIAALLYRGDENLSHRNEEPEAASRPFEAGRDGLVNGEGAASLILERRAHAEARGANVLASLAGYGRSFEPRLGVVPPSGDGTRRCVRDALKMAAVEPSQLSHVNAHGLSSPALDAVEAGALRDVIGDTLVTAPKSLFGNLGAGGGLVELVVSILSLQHGLVPGTLNYRQPDPQCPLNLSPETQAAAGRFALAVNQSATGQAASVVIQKPE